MDQKSKHTPGPWKACGADQCKCGITFSIPGDFPVCTVANETGRNLQVVAVAHEHMADAPDMIYATISSEQRDANQRLIAAAPDMLAALKLQMACICEGGPTDAQLRQATTTMREAIAKAGG